MFPLRWHPGPDKDYLSGNLVKVAPRGVISTPFNAGGFVPGFSEAAMNGGFSGIDVGKVRFGGAETDDCFTFGGSCQGWFSSEIKSGCRVDRAQASGAVRWIQ